MTQKNAKAMALLKGIAGEHRRDAADEVVIITDQPGVVLFIGFASEPKPESAPEATTRARW